MKRQIYAFFAVSDLFMFCMSTVSFLSILTVNACFAAPDSEFPFD